MKLKLIQSGGIAGKNMVGQVKSKLTEEDWKALASAVKKPKGKSRGKDMYYYTLQNEAAEEVEMDINAIPQEHMALFKSLFDKLKVEK